ncbi:MAG: MmcQ/YjbR family DNA-binding protein [Streptosporangiales bacterium]|nr:MmcQ/YjbR family DNA-binding protein [Streptosporangiales bacterium]
MATWDDVRDIVAKLPETTESVTYGDALCWRVRKKGFVWERPLRRKDLEALGDASPTGQILGAYVPDLGAKEALLADEPGVFTTPHFDDYPVILIRLDEIAVPELQEIVVEAWLDQAPKRLTQSYLSSRP